MSNKRKVIAILAGLFPVAAFADISGTLTVNANTQVSMDTGTTVSSGGDFLWSGTTLTPQGGAIALNVTAVLPTVSGATGFATVTQMLLMEFASQGSSNAISGLAVGNVVGYMTIGGNLGKFLVTSITGTTLAIQYMTYISVTPKITLVQNNYSFLPPGLPNYGIAPGSIMFLKGSSLANALVGTLSLQSTISPGLPLSLNGASISVTVGGVTVHPAIYYAIPSQIAAVLPSSTPTGTGTVTVTYNGTASNAATILVVPAALGLSTYTISGAATALANDPVSGVLFNFTNSIVPGKTIVLWGSGLGADTADSDTVFTSTPHAVNVPLAIYIGGVQASVLYAGSSGYPGYNQINVTVPNSVPTGCFVSAVAISGSGSTSIVSNSVTLPISAAGGVCTDPILGINGNQITNPPTQSSNYTAANLGITQGTSAQNGETTFLSASFQSYQGFTSGTPTAFSLGSCIVSTSGGSIVAPTGTITGLDAGTITVTGPAGSQTLTEIANPLSSGPTGSYEAQVANSFLPATGGTFTFTGSGGANVGAFTASISLSNLLTWTNESSISSVTRASGQNITWSGGAPNTYVYVIGSSASSLGGASATFICYAPASAGQLTVPNYVLLALPAGSGSLGVANSSAPASFTASGLSAPGVVTGSVSYSLSPTYN